jgi:hypothetical protein
VVNKAANRTPARSERFMADVLWWIRPRQRLRSFG